MRTSDILTQPLGLQQVDVPAAHGQADSASKVTATPVEQRWIRICTVDEIPQLGARVVTRKGEPNVAVFRTADDKLFALADSCPHRGGPLSQGIVFGERVACPLHNTCVDLSSGCAVAPDTGQVQRYGVRVDAGAVYVDLEIPVDAHR
ncbi:MAG TPA: nitrite reductase small subunit NirD [Burkholderiales bacterium]|nr:nitrite reductase small subunit NirD [Burkholderiales bacterium]